MTRPRPPLIIGTRGSALALAQAEQTRARLAAAHAELAAPGAIAIRIIQTTGDAVTDRALAAIGGKGLFTKEIEQALAAGEIDIAVHSMKDVPTVLPEGLVIDCLLPREDPRDALFCRDAASLAELRQGAVIGTASLRRQAQLRMLRPDLVIVPLRGNVGTRLRKLAEGEVEATLLAIAGLNRLGHPQAPTELLDPATMLPAVAQGAIGIERRIDDELAERWLAPLNDPVTARRVAAERALLTALDGSCRTPIAALSLIEGDMLSLRALIAMPDGSAWHATELSGAVADAESLGFEAADRLRAAAGPAFFTALAAQAAAP